MAKVHDKFVIELAEVIKGYGNDPDVDDPFRLSEFYRFYELPEIAVSANHFKTMIPLEVVEKNAQPGWIPCSKEMPPKKGRYLVTEKDAFDNIKVCFRYWNTDCLWSGDQMDKVLAWCEIPEPWEGAQDD